LSDFLKNILNFSVSVKNQTQDYSAQSVKLMEANNKAIKATFVGDPEAGSKQVAPEDAHPNQVKDLKEKLVLSISKTLSDELYLIAEKDYPDIKQFISSLDTFLGSAGDSNIKTIIKDSCRVIADAIMAHSVPMESGNTVDILSSNEMKVVGSSIVQAGSIIKQEAPVITDTAFNRILLAHTLVEKADILVNRAVTMIQNVKEEFGLSAKDIAIVASNNIKISGSRIDLNPTGLTKPNTSFDSGQKVKNMTQLPQWDGMSPVPVFIPSD
jgi:hypothetical protein